MSRFKKILIVTLIISLPINIMGFVWLNRTVDAFNQMAKYKLTISEEDRFYNVGNIILDHLNKEILHILGLNKKVDVQLLVKNSGLKRLFANMPKSGSNYEDDSLLIVDNKIMIGKAKLRGDHMYHWAFPRKSWRFKTSKKNIYKGINKLNFIIPKSLDLLSNHMSYKLAQSLGLLAPESKVVELSLNGIYQEARLMVEQIDESFLRRNRRMPNDIYKGDNIGQKKFIGINAGLFNHASIWEKAAHNNHYDQENRVPLQKMIQDLYHNSFELLDLRSFAAMSLLLDLTTSYHHDQNHNWMLSYDHYYEKMVPIIWDTTGWLQRNMGQTDMNISSSELLEKLFQDYDFMKLKYHVIYDFFQNTEQSFKTMLNGEVERAQKITQNKDLGALSIGPKITPQTSLEAIDVFRENVWLKLDQVKQHFMGDIDEKNYSYALIDHTIRLSIAGDKMINKVIIDTSSVQKLSKVTLRYLKAEQEISFDIPYRINDQKGKVIIDLELLANASIEKAFKHTKTIFNQATYDLILTGVGSEEINGVSLSFLNSHQQKISIQKVDDIKPLKFKNQYRNIVSKIATKQTIIWNGDKHFSGFTEVTDDVIIEPGTRLIFDQAASLKVYGKITAIGTKQAPIIFTAKDSSKPWGALAIKDRAADGSVFKHVIFKDGSGDKGDLHEYTAMFSVHNVHNLLVEDTEFYDSKLTDDMVHVIYSDVTFKNSKFVRSLSDALDIDISTAVIDHCEFVNSGNDAVDLMTSDAVVINSTFSHSQDKGISIGESSRLLAINNLIENNEIGMQSKDTSKAYIYNTSFIGNNTAIDAYHKNWRYSDGGTIMVDKCLMRDNKANATVGKKSLVVINGCEIDDSDMFNKKDMYKAKIVVSEKEGIKADFSSPFFHGYADLITENRGHY